jgi:hypothetical protein
MEDPLMHARVMPTDIHLDRPWFVWPALLLEVFTAIAAIPVGWSLITDPTGGGIGLPSDWIASSVFGTYLVPGLYLFLMNGLGMLAVAILSLVRHWSAPWLTGVLGVGLVGWILVQLVVMPETSTLQWLFLAVGLILAVVSMAWLRRTGQLRLW